MKNRLPFSWINNDFGVIAALWGGTLPEPSDALKTPLDLWFVIENCWEADSARRANGISLLLALSVLVRQIDYYVYQVLNVSV